MKITSPPSRRVWVFVLVVDVVQLAAYVAVLVLDKRHPLVLWAGAITLSVVLTIIGNFVRKRWKNTG